MTGLTPQQAADVLHDAIESGQPQATIDTVRALLWQTVGRTDADNDPTFDPDDDGSWRRECSIRVLLGRTITGVERSADDWVQFRTSDGKAWRMYYEPD